MPVQPGTNNDLPPRTGLITVPAPKGGLVPSRPVLPLQSMPRADVLPEESGISCCDILDSMAENAMLADASGRILFANSCLCELLGYSPDEARSLRLTDIVCGAEPGLMQSVAEMLGRNPRVCIRCFLARKDGSAVPADILVSSLAAGKPILLLILNDTSRMQEAEQALKTVSADVSRAKRMEAAATVAGQIAHDFDNLLTPLFAYPEIIRRDLPEKCRGRELLDIIEKTAHDMAQITQQLLVLSRRGQHRQTPFNLNDLVGRVSAMHHDEADARGIEIILNLDGNLLPMKGSPEQMLRVIENLFHNAMDAMEQSGKITFATKNVYIDRPFGKYERINVGEYVKLSVSDTGCGIPEEIREKIFEPFFTTRKTARKRGSGLGLSVVQGIVGDHGGLIDLDSSIGHGTTFHLYFPIFREAGESGEEPGNERMSGAGRTVLVVDDDSQQREIIGSLFDVNGFKVTTLPSGESAVELIAQCSQSTGKNGNANDKFPDLIVLDVVMDPGMDGKETCKRILEINPRQRILLVSGYPAPEDVGIRQLAPGVSYLGKPLTWQRISGAIHWKGDSQEKAPLANAVPCTPNTILLVDDEEGIRRLFNMLLSSAFPRATIESAADGAEGVAFFKKLHPAVVVLDLKMPVMDGESAFSAIRSYCRENNWQLPAVVFCTGFAPPSVVRRIASAEKEHCLLAKPVSGDDLIHAVRERLAMRQ